jgi:hypothetical protein
MSPVEESKTQKATKLDNHIDHVRVVHLSLLTVCFVLLSAWALSRETEVKRAANQLREIDNVVQSWNPKWLDSYADSLVHQGRPSAIDQSPEKCVIREGADQTQLKIELKHPNWTIQPLPQSLERWVRHESSGRKYSREYLPSAPEINQPQTLGQFAELWDALQEDIAIYTPSGPATKGVTSEEEIFNVICGSPTTDVRSLQLELRSVGSSEESDFLKKVAGEDFKYAYFGDVPGSQKSDQVAIPVRTTTLQKFQAQSSLKRMYGTGWDLGPFSRAFPDLSKVTQNYKNLRFTDLFQVLETEATRSEDRIEIFGAKIPTPAISQWGALIILIVQAYLLLNLQSLKSLLRSDSEIDSPWIGFYSSRSAKAATIVSALVFPSIVLIILSLSQFEVNGSRWTSACSLLAVGVSVWLSVSAMMVLRRIWHVRSLSVS